MKEIIKRLKCSMIEINLSSQELAEKVGVAPSTISRFCADECQVSVKTYMKICDVLRVNPTWLWHGYDQRNNGAWLLKNTCRDDG